MKKNFKLTLEYDGTEYSGWQVQNNSPTIQGEIENALGLMLDQPIRIWGSGRTDAGVHALAQVANFQASTSMGQSQLKKGLNSLLKGPIVVHECTEVDEAFHARYNAREKEYHYFFLNRELPCAVGRNFVWHIRHPLKIDAMEECCRIITGTHDFKAFEGAGSPRSTTVRTLFLAGFEKTAKDRFYFKIRGNGFLRFMVRNIVGTLVLAGAGKITPIDFRKILQGRDRSLAGPTAPAKGLFLMKVSY
ncbi:MAG: tRNA pseudouridine(38-40) synthase TruA [Desulfobacterium sp.]|nr:tRNA pseudouridine(38-40) synthase TruA [Desulfobacterium sp.]